jgi:pyruvate dehydrogenase E2 component (dihydrolipoamide acetyltransferase)
VQKGRELMAEDLFIPKLGQTVEEVILVNWLVEDGAKVDFGDPVLEVETDKAVFNVEANAKGTLHIGPYQIGETLPVLTVVATIGKQDEAFAPSAKVLSPEGEPQAEPEQIQSDTQASEQVVEETQKPPAREKVFASPRAKKLARSEKVDLSLVAPTGGEGIRVVEQDVRDYLQQAAPKATPISAGLAKEVGLSLSEVAGTGAMGIITRDDVIRAIRAKLQMPAVKAAPPPIPTADTGLHVRERIPLRSVRKLIFDRMGQSVHTTARVTEFIEVDATALVAMREKFKAEKAGAWGFTPGYNELIGALVARTLPDFPLMNARVSPDEQAIEYLADVNLGIAVDTNRGLVVPVIKNANQIDLYKFGVLFRQLVERALAGRTMPEDIEGGTFTITNLGNFEISGFTPVINLPQAAILGVGSIQDQVVPYKGEIAIRKMLTLSLVFDHRLIDGAPAAQFLQKIKHNIEAPTILSS